MDTTPASWLSQTNVVVGSDASGNIGDNGDSAVRLRVQIFLRWLAVIGQLAAVLLVGFGLEFQLPIIELLFTISASVLLNAWLVLRYPVSHLLTGREAAAYLAYDLTQLGILLYLTGGLMNPFALLFLAPVTISASVLQARTTALLVGMASAWVSILLFYHQPLPWSGTAPELPSIYMIGIWAALLIALVFIPSYVWRVSREGRRMSAALAASQRVIEREQRLSALDGLAAAAAHKLGTPLGTIALVSRELQTNPNLHDALRDDVQLMVEQANRCRDILASLTAEDTKDPVISRLSLGALLEEAVLEIGPSDKTVHVSCAPDDASIGDTVSEIAEKTPKTSAAPEILREPELIYGIGNLIANAADFAAQNVWVCGRYSATEVRIEIADDGPGFQPDILARLGEPYNTTRARAERDAQDEGHTGMGLGYFIARTLLLRSGGRIEARNLEPSETVADSQPGGAYVAIHWPRSRFDAKAN